MVNEEEYEEAKEHQGGSLVPVNLGNPLVEDEPDSMVIRAETQLSKYYKSNVQSLEKYACYLDFPHTFWKG